MCGKYLFIAILRKISIPERRILSKWFNITINSLIMKVIRRAYVISTLMISAIFSLMIFRTQRESPCSDMDKWRVISHSPRSDKFQHPVSVYDCLLFTDNTLFVLLFFIENSSISQ